jgi:hypothetical protein
MSRLYKKGYNYDCPEPSRLNKNHEYDGNQYKHKKKDYEKSDKKKKKSFKKKEQIKAFLGEWITDGDPRRRSPGSPSTMMNHLYLHHPCVSWQDVTTR